MASQWYYAQDGQQLGPVSSEQLKQLAQTGQLNPTDLIWKDGLAEWTPARKVAGLFSTAAAHAAAAPATATVATAPAPAYAAPAPAYAAAPVAQAYAPQASTGYAGGAASTDYPQAAYGQQAYAQPASALAYEAPTSDSLVITPRSIEMLRQTRPWVLFLGILGFVGAALAVLSAVGGLVMAVAAPSSSSGPPMAVIGLVYLVMYGGLAIVYAIGAWLLTRYSSSILGLTRLRRPVDMETALAAQKSFWKFAGICAIVGLIVTVLVIVIAVIGVAMSMR